MNHSVLCQKVDAVCRDGLEIALIDAPASFHPPLTNTSELKREMWQVGLKLDTTSATTSLHKGIAVTSLEPRGMA